MTYYSQFKQDEVIYNNFLKHIDKGYFVDIGAHDGKLFSNSLFFEELGWDGVCIEPNPNVFKVLESHRKCKCKNYAMSDKIGEAQFFQIIGAPDMLSGLVEDFTENAISRINEEMKTHNCVNEYEYINVKTELFDNLVESKTINFLSLDTEGNEMKILKTIDFDKYDIQVITVENNDFDNKFNVFFSDKPYTFMGRLQCDEIYVKNYMLDKK
jgi:FkbM family methyltransferase